MNYLEKLDRNLKDIDETYKKIEFMASVKIDYPLDKDIKHLRKVLISTRNLILKKCKKFGYSRLENESALLIQLDKLIEGLKKLKDIRSQK